MSSRSSPCSSLAAPLRALTYAALLLELLAPLLLWIRGLSRFWALGLIGLHANLEALTNIGWWQRVMISVFWCSFRQRGVAPLIEAPRRSLAAPACGPSTRS